MLVDVIVVEGSFSESILIIVMIGDGWYFRGSNLGL